MCGGVGCVAIPRFIASTVNATCLPSSFKKRFERGK